MPFLAPPGHAGDLATLGAYRVLRILGQGGMGVVYLAIDPKLGRQVAIKVMLPTAAQKPDARERFLREARMVAQLEHDHIVAIHQVDEFHGAPFLVMPLLKGMSLHDYLERKRPLSMFQIVRIGRELALGLAAAHQRGLIHRDIKPANLWLDANAKGRVKILDWGLARPEQSDVRLTAENVVVGTPSFMAPEQAGGAPVDARTDLYAVGAVLYRMVAGQVPFPRETILAMLSALATETPRPAAELNPSVPPELADLIERLMAKRPDARPADAQSVATELAAIERRLAAKPASPHDSSEIEADALTPGQSVPLGDTVAVAPVRRGRRVRIGAAGIAVVAAALVTWQFEARRPQGDRVEPIASPDARPVSAPRTYSPPTLAYERRPFGDGGTVFDMLVSASGKWCLVVGAQTNPPANLVGYDLATGKEQVRHAAVGLRHVALTPDDATLVLRAFRTLRTGTWPPSETFDTVDRPTRMSGFGLAPDGTHAVWGEVDASGMLSVVRHDYATGQTKATPADEKGGLAWTFAPDGKRACMAVGDGTGPRARVLDVATNTPLFRFTPANASLAWSKDSARLAYAEGPVLQIVVARAIDGSILQRGPAPSNGGVGPFLDDGHLLWVGSEGRVHVVDAATLRVVTTFVAEPASSIVGVGISADGRRLATLSKAGSLKVWNFSE